jgi:SAM-dependent methyltransferase
MPDGWEWDETLYAGSAEHYERGRLPYPARLVDAAASALVLDGSGRLIDVGCGPGIVALSLASLFEEVVGVDADRQMVEQAARRSVELRTSNTTWVAMRAEDLPGDLGRFRVATFAQSFHWLDRDRVAAAIFTMLEPGGAFVQVNHWSLLGDPAPETSHPVPPHDEIKRLIEKYLGAARRAGKGILPAGTPDNEASVIAAAGFEGPQRVPVPGGEIVMVSVDDMIARCLSASGSAPHLFGARLAAFEHELTSCLDNASKSGVFAERIRDADLLIWRKPPHGLGRAGLGGRA